LECCDLGGAVDPAGGHHAGKNPRPEGAARNGSSCRLVLLSKAALKADPWALRFQFVPATHCRGDGAGAVSVGPVCITMGTYVITYILC
jgi:hypothetical protein